jgi:ABC-type Fe3+-siderophore transport system permease subunit
MNVYIGPLGAAILLVGIVVGCIVYKHTRTPLGRGDIVGAIASAAAVITVLALLLGGGTKTTPDGESPAQDTSITTAR